MNLNVQFATATGCGVAALVVLAAAVVLAGRAHRGES